MGFLDHSTNNIIVDAVLTDKGRQALAKNDGSFNIHQFALGDDEVDYSIIQQFGRNVGKEKIEKNTPVLEAVTQSSLGLKFPLVSISNDFLTHLPTMTITTKDTPVTFSRSSNISTKEFTISVEMQNGTSIEFDLMDSEYLIELNHLFLSIPNETPDIIYNDNRSVYRIETGQTTTGQSVNTRKELRLKAFSTTTFNTYSISGGSYIRTYVKVTGLNSGLTKNFEVQIS
jgi:hypothetical protein